MQFRDTPAATLESFVILERVLRDQFEISDRNDDKAGLTAVIRNPKDVPCDTVGNPADPDASFNAHKGHGYLALIVETYCEDEEELCPKVDGAVKRLFGNLALSIPRSIIICGSSVGPDVEMAASAISEFFIRRFGPAGPLYGSAAAHR